MPQLNAIGIVVSDMGRSISFYRLLGLDVPETPDEGHVDTFLPNGVRFMLDTEDTVRGFRPEWTRTTGNQVGLALECGTPGEVDEVYDRVTEGQVPKREGAMGCLLGPAVRATAGPRWRPRRSLRPALSFMDRARASARKERAVL
jgi:hypothetical protein